MMIGFTLNGEAVTAELLDNASSRSLQQRLQMSLTLDDYGSNEKIGYLSSALDIHDAPDGYAARSGDLCYYAPWANLAFFHADGRFAPGLVPLGRVTAGLDALRRRGTYEITLTNQTGN